METFCALIRGDLAPAGNKISLVSSADPVSYQLAGYSATWVDSGTSALALALANVKAGAPQVKYPKVIIPGYCCPDLVAAAVYAGARPLAVDIKATDAGYDLAALKSAIDDEDVIAVIAVNFLGIKEHLDDIRAILANTNIKLIEDNAQWFPARFEEQDFVSDYVLFSFGRGKPLSLLGGGVLFSKINIMVSSLVLPVAENTVVNSIKQRIKLYAYNMLLHPRLYCFLNRAPFLRLGETRYHPLTEIVAMDGFRKMLFVANWNMYVSRDRWVEHAYDDSPVISLMQQLTSLSTARRKKLLRYPLLCVDSAKRDGVLRKLNAAGLGCSPMYQHAICDIAGVAGLIEIHATLKNASNFARCLLTIPTHEYVSEKYVRRIDDIIRCN